MMIFVFMPSKIKFIKSKREKARKWLQFVNLVLPVCSICVLLLDEWRLYHTRTQHLIPRDSFCLLCEPIPAGFGEGHRWRRLWEMDWVSEGLTHTNYQSWTSHPLESVYLFPVLSYWTPSRDLKYLTSSKTRVSRCPIPYVVLVFLSGGTDLPVEIHVMCWSTSSKPALASLTHLQPITGDPAILIC